MNIALLYNVIGRINYSYLQQTEKDNVRILNV